MNVSVTLKVYKCTFQNFILRISFFPFNLFLCAVWSESSALFSSIGMINHRFHTELKVLLGFILNSSIYCVLFLKHSSMCLFFMLFHVFNNDNDFVVGIWYRKYFLIIFPHKFS